MIWPLLYFDLCLIISALEVMYFVAVLCWFSLVLVLKWTPSFLISLCWPNLSVVLECEVNSSIESMGCICLHVEFLDPFIWVCFLRIVNVEFIEVVPFFPFSCSIQQVFWLGYPQYRSLLFYFWKYIKQFKCLLLFDRFKWWGIPAF